MSQNDPFAQQQSSDANISRDTGLTGMLRRIGRRRAIQMGALALVPFVEAGLIHGTAHAQSPSPEPLPLPYDFIPSPNYGERPPGTVVSCIVLHATVEPTTEGTIRIFQDDIRPNANRVSAHFVVGRDGRVVQMVPIEKRAWHAGASSLDGVPNVNHYSVGIEMVNLNDGTEAYPEEQYRAVAGIIRFLRSRFTIPDSRIVSHEKIARNAGRSDKTDPFGFDFEKVYALARNGITGPVDAATPVISSASKS